MPDYFTERKIDQRPTLTPTHDLLETCEESPMNSEVLLLPKIEKEEIEKAEPQETELKKEDELKQSKSFNIKDWVQEVKKRMEVEPIARKPLSLKKKNIEFDDTIYPQPLGHSATFEVLPTTSYMRLIKQRVERKRDASIDSN